MDWLIFEDENVSTGTNGYHPLEEILGSTFTNNTSIVSLKAGLRFTRFLRFKFGGVTSTGMLAEVEAFGRGFPAEGRYISKVHSFAGQVSLGRITWNFTKYRQTSSGEVSVDSAAPGRSCCSAPGRGSDADPLDYFIFDELGRQVLVDRETYFEGPPPRSQFEISSVNSGGLAGYRASRSDDITHWNNWSVPYQTSGDEIRSSDGREFFQFRFEIKTADPLAFGVLDSVAFEFAPVLADSVLGEVSLAGLTDDQQGVVEVPLGVDTLFVYDIRTVFSTDARPGFDGVELDVPAGARFVGLERDGAELLEGTDFSQQAAAGLLRVLFAEPIAEDTGLAAPLSQRHLPGLRLYGRTDIQQRRRSLLACHSRLSRATLARRAAATASRWWRPRSKRVLSETCDFRPRSSLPTAMGSMRRPWFPSTCSASPVLESGSRSTT